MNVRMQQKRRGLTPVKIRCCLGGQSGSNLLIIMLLSALLWSVTMRPRTMQSLTEDFQSIVSTEPQIVMFSYIFGTSNAYVRMFVESARHSGINVVIIGSPVPSFPLPPNVRHVQMSWEEFADRVSTRLFDGERLPRLVDAKRRRINDFKPFSAHLFPEEVQGYGWWGHIDNDLLLGDVRHFITEEMLSQYDVISPLTPENGMHRTWGPFMLYRNANVTNQLFRLASHPLKELVDKSELLVLDEGGRLGRRPGKSPFWNSSISGIVNNYKERLGLRVWREGLLCKWDGLCGKDEEHCAECTLTLPTHAERQTLTAKFDLNCIAEDEKCYQEVLLCHYQYGKSNLEKSLQGQGDKVMRLINDGQLKASYLEGFMEYPLENKVRLS